MKRAIILHGTLGSPEGNWFQWFAAELQKRGLEVWVPQLPHTEQPSLREMSDFVFLHAPFPLDRDTMLIGHSSGAILALIVAQVSSNRLESVVCVSVFHDNSLNWSPNSRLFDVPFAFDAIRKHVTKFLFVHSDNDPYVPLDQARYVAEQCAGELLVVPGEGHFNLERSSAYTKFPALLTALTERSML